MSVKIKQIRYYGEENENNSVGLSSLKNIDVIENEIGKVSVFQLGIQAIPGTKFTINDSEKENIIGPIGLWEIDLSNSSSGITSLKFNEDSLNIITNMDNACIIVDMAYEKGGSD